MQQDIGSFQLVRSEERDPAINLALEEWLFRHRSGDEAVFLLYRNSPCIVIGRNQNPWLECNLFALQRRGIPLHRRVSGGGTVYHDEGNLNYSFILPRGAYDPDRWLAYVVDALAALGVEAWICDRHSIRVGERKVSGTAFLITGRTAMVHGCLLVNADLDALHGCLKPAPGVRLETKAIRSVPAQVANLADLGVAAPVDGVGAALEAIIRDRHPVTGPRTIGCPDAEADPTFAELAAKQRDPDWVFGRTGTFQHIPEPEGGGESPVLTVKGARIVDVALPGGARGDGSNLSERLVGLPYDGEILGRAVSALPGSAWGQRLAEALRREIPPTRSCAGSPQ